MDLNQIRDWVKYFEKTDVDALEVRRFFSTIRMTKNSGSPLYLASYDMPADYVHSTPVSHGSFGSVSKRERYMLVKSDTSHPIGHFYLCKDPWNPDPESEDRKPVVWTDREVKKGDPLYYLDSLKLIHETSAPCTGIVRCILVSPGTPIQYNTKLFVIEKTEE